MLLRNHTDVYRINHHLKPLVSQENDWTIRIKYSQLSELAVYKRDSYINIFGSQAHELIKFYAVNKFVDTRALIISNSFAVSFIDLHRSNYSRHQMADGWIINESYTYRYKMFQTSTADVCSGICDSNDSAKPTLPVSYTHLTLPTKA